MPKEHLKNEGQVGLALLALWQAVIVRMAEIYQVDHLHFPSYGPELSKNRPGTERLA
ncbi:MAG: hypothetical protein R3B93_21050 [Bacteroidia bacterium]